MSVQPPGSVFRPAVVRYPPARVYTRIGGSLDSEAVAKTNEALKNAQVLELYTTEARADSAFDALYDVGGAAKALIGLWVQDPANLRRAYGSVNKDVPPITKPDDLHASYVRAWATIRIRMTWSQVHMAQGLASKSGIWVLIPLENWNRNNGSLFQVMTEVRAGQDLTIDGMAPLTFLGAGGCTVICLSLVEH